MKQMVWSKINPHLKGVNSLREGGTLKYLVHNLVGHVHYICQWLSLGVKG